MDGFQRSWRIFIAGLAVMKANPRLLLFPVLAAIAVFAIAFAVFRPVGALARMPEFAAFGLAGIVMLSLAAIGGVYFGWCFAVTFANAALVACALKAIDGAPVSIGAGLVAAARRIHVIFVWSAIVGTIGALLRLVVEEMTTKSRGRFGSGGRLVEKLFGAGFYTAWLAGTFFMLPVLVIEGLGLFAATKRSTRLVAARWRDVVGAAARFALLALALMLPAFVAMYGWQQLNEGGHSGGGLLLGAAAAWFVTVTVLVSACSTIFLAALYRYAVTGTAPAAYDRALIATAFIARTK
jgi:hypothetical protein